jgi:hypothetical protein
MASVQPALFHELPRLPKGFRYEEELLSPKEERALMSTFERLPALHLAAIKLPTSHARFMREERKPSGSVAEIAFSTVQWVQRASG